MKSYPPIFENAQLAKMLQAVEDFRYFYGVLIQVHCWEDKKPVLWNVGGQNALGLESACFAIQGWLAAGRVQVADDDPRVA